MKIRLREIYFRGFSKKLRVVRGSKLGKNPRGDSSDLQPKKTLKLKVIRRTSKVFQNFNFCPELGRCTTLLYGGSYKKEY